MKKLTKKEIKNLKKDVAENGASNQGYFYTVRDVIDYDDMIEVFEYASDSGLNFHEFHDCDYLDFVLTTLARVLGYQAFKKLVPHFMGYSAYTLIKGELVERI